jgi:hypothetical protein
MAFVRAIKKKYGTYYALVENKRINGKVVQKVIKYLGTSPNEQEIQIEPKIAVTIAQTLISGSATATDVKKVLKNIGLPIKGRLKQVSLIYKPPLRKFTLRVE